MAETLLSFGVEKLWDLRVRESARLEGVDEQLAGLKRDLNSLRSFLKDADAKKRTSAMVRNSVTEIKEIVYDAEDIIETFLLREELRKTSGIRNTVRRFTFGTLERRGLALDMEALRKRISEVIRMMEIHGVQQVNVNTQSLQREMRQTFSSDTEEHLVGLETNVERLVGYLVKEDSSQVVSITGMGGLGKTTLAKQVFNHETVKSHFAGLAWVCVSQQCSRKDVWQTILRKLKPDNKGSEMTEDELQENLVQVLKTQKALIVLDDIWREEHWDIIKPMFPREKGWKVLLTSRNEGVGLRADPKCFTFKPNFLTLEECWTIFQRKVFPRENSTEFKVDVEKEELGKKMIKHCGGLPLAIKALGGLLAGQHSLSEWKRICENIGSHIVGGTSVSDTNISLEEHILYLSFEELPNYLKHCFLYLAHFPEDYSIDVEKLSYYWAAEGIPRPRYYDGLTSREVADRYITELVKRSMVISERDAKTSRFEKCLLHDMMREVCLRKAEEENFVDIVDIENSQSTCKSRRIAVYYHGSYDPKEMVENQKLRSLLFIKGQYGMKLWDLLFKRLQLLRALDLYWAEFEGRKVPSSIGKLIHLRYLSLHMAEVTHLPSSMRNLKQLLYLNLCVLSSTSNVYMPNNVFNEMRELIYLYLPLPHSINDEVKINLGNLVNLETLVNFSTKHSNVRDLQRMTRLETLSIKFNGGCTMENLSSSLSELRRLENLTIHEDYKKDEEGFFLDCDHLKKVDLRIYMPRLPDEQHFPSHLTTIFLQYCLLEEDPMPILEKLLHLRELLLRERSFVGKKMVCSSGGFPQLQNLFLEELEEWEKWIVEEGSMPLLHTLTIWDCKKLKKLRDGFPQLQKLELVRLEEWEGWIVEEGSLPLLHTLTIWDCKKLKKLPDGFPQLQNLRLEGLEEWEVWIVEEGSMPLLHTLTIRNCPKLNELPDGLRFITSLKELYIYDAPLEFKEKLSRGGEDFYKVQHIPLVGVYQD